MTYSGPAAWDSGANENKALTPSTNVARDHPRTQKTDRQHHKLAVVVVVVLLLSGLVLIHLTFEASIATGDARSLCHRAIVVMGGRRVLESDRVGGVEQVQRLSGNSAPALKSAYYYSRDSWLWVTQDGAERESICVNRQDGWEDLDGIVCDLPAEEYLLRKAESIRVTDLLLKAGTPGYSLSNQGWKTLPEGVRCQLVRMTNPGNSPVDFYFDPVTGLLAAEGTIEHGLHTGRQSYYLNRYVGYRRWDRRQVPWRVDLYADGTLLSTTTILKRLLTLGPGVFNKPVTWTTHATTTIPFEYSAGIPVILVSLNGGPARRFALDTGSVRTTLSSKLARELHLTPMTAAARTIGFRSGKSVIAQLTSLTIGGETVRNLPVEFNDLFLDPRSSSSYEGLIGYNFLGHFQVTLDYSKHTLTLGPRFSPASAGKPAEMQVKGGETWVQASAGGHQFMMGLDTGSSEIYLSPAVASSLRLRPGVSGWQETTSDGCLVSGWLARLPEVTACGQSLSGIPIQFNDREDALRCKLPDLPSLLGNSFLKHFRVTLDYARHQVVLQRPESGV